MWVSFCTIRVASLNQSNVMIWKRYTYL